MKSFYSQCFPGKYCLFMLFMHNTSIAGITEKCFTDMEEKRNILGEERKNKKKKRNRIS